MNTKESHCVISKEVLLLLRWLCENDTALLNKIVARAWTRGFGSYMQQVDYENFDPEATHATVLDFFNILEEHLTKVQEEHKEQLCHAASQGYTKQLAQIDMQHYTSESLLKTLDATSSFLKENPLASPKDIFFKEFLKSWQPQDDTVQ